MNVMLAKLLSAFLIILILRLSLWGATIYHNIIIHLLMTPWIFKLVSGQSKNDLMVGRHWTIIDDARKVYNH